MNQNNYVPLEVLEDYAEDFNKQEGSKYPCSNQIVLCGVITKDRAKAIDFMKNKNVVCKREQRSKIIWFLDNGERWMWCNWNINYRGYRFYKVAIDRWIDVELFRRICVLCSGYCCSFEIV